ncbi:general secretion pathway protein H [Psychromonas sp. CNPT3]|uniref:type II secretion system minor pseudopilin GspH n=1 Tax=Psychromonas sp. CNPT3 TaxID=314282 RepID=UPI00006E705A|nr:type II secretion system minor pseudopilin GspH [Psychromonas sp. CNPT3]AGH80125.1 general secretion pathway protein H [Psychromonas sp. CNPT3]
MQALKARQQGFTLLEIMLVVLIMAMVSVVVVMNLPKITERQQDLDWQAQRFVTLLSFAQDEALMSGKELGIIFKDNAYQFVVYAYKEKAWQALELKRIITDVTLAEPLTLHYALLGALWEELDSQNVNVKPGTLAPQVYIMSSGEVTPFTLQFLNTQDGDRPASALLSINMSGEITKEDTHESP